MNSPHILIVEDEPAIQDLLTFNMTQAGFESSKAADVDTAWERIRERLPSLILLDWMLPNCSGINFARALRADARTSKIPIIMLTAKGEEADKITGLESGADDYITKPFSPRELLARVRAVLRRHSLTDEAGDDTIVIAELSLSPSAHKVKASNQAIELGPTEFRLLHFLMTHPERVYSRGQLLDQVWGTHKFVEERTVDVHVRRLRVALQPYEQDKLIQTIRGRGYIFSAG